MAQKEIDIADRKTRETCRSIRNAFMELLGHEPYSAISVTEICRMANVNRGTFYNHYYDIDDLLGDVLDQYLSDVSGTIDHVLCPQKETCTYPFCQKLQKNKELWPLFLDNAVAEKIINRLWERGRDGFVGYLTQHGDISTEQAEAIFSFQLNGCLAMNRQMIKSGRRNWKATQQTIDKFIRGGLREFLSDGE